MPSFDVVSEVDFAEVDNAVNQANKELAQRYDFRGTNSTIERKEGEIQIDSTDEFKVKAVTEVLDLRLAKRKVPLGALVYGNIEASAGGRSKRQITVRTGLETEICKKIAKQVKTMKIKVQAAIQGDSVRISGKKRDALQEVMAALREADYGQPLQFNNFRD